MLKLSVEYWLDEKMEQRLNKITEEYNKHVQRKTREEVFEIIMQEKNISCINSRFELYEYRLNIKNKT